jgi:hypothetical protein
MVTESEVLKLARIHFPDKEVKNITDLGIWLRHTFRVQFDDSNSVLYKFHTNPELDDGSVHEYRVTEILKYAGLPAADILIVDNTKSLVDEPFVVTAEGSGERLDRIKFGDSCLLCAWRVLQKIAQNSYEKIRSLAG